MNAMTTTSHALIPLDSGNLPQVFKPYAVTGADEEFATGRRQGFPVVSIKGKVFHVARGDELEMLCKPGSDEPAGSIEVVVLRATPGLSRTFYKGKYVEGSVEKPDCYSVDGKAPAVDAQLPQAKSCAACPHAQWGSRITEDGKKAMACANFKRLAVAPAGMVSDPMLLRVPGASLKAWDEYVKWLAQRGLRPFMVQTKISFDWSVAYPALTFKALGVLPADVAAEVVAERSSELCESIVGATNTEAEQIETDGADTKVLAEALTGGADAPTESEKPAAQPAPRTRQKRTPAPANLAREVEQVEQETPVAIKVEGGEGILDELDAAIDGLEFDD